MRVPFHELRSNFMSRKFIFQVGNKITSYKLLFSSCELLFTSCKFKEIILRVTNCVLWIKNLKILFYELPVAFYELKVQDDKFTSWKFKMIIFQSWEFQSQMRVSPSITRILISRTLLKHLTSRTLPTRDIFWLVRT